MRKINEKIKGMLEVREGFLGFTELKVANSEKITKMLISHVCVVKALKMLASTMSEHISGRHASIS